MDGKLVEPIQTDALPTNRIRPMWSQDQPKRMGEPWTRDSLPAGEGQLPPLGDHIRDGANHVRRRERIISERFGSTRSGEEDYTAEAQIGRAAEYRCFSQISSVGEGD